MIASAAARSVSQDSDPGGDDVSVFRVETRLVQVDAVVRDDDGPVDDLTIEDFTLYVDGEPQEIAVFEQQRNGRAESAGPRLVPEGGVSNRPPQSVDQPAGATIILLDRLNTQVEDQPRANVQLLEFLEALDGRHSVAIYELRGQLRLIQDYTNDKEVLMRSARSMGVEFSSRLDASYGEGVSGGFESGPNEVGLDPELVNARLGTGIEDRGTTQLDQQVAAYYTNSRVRITAEVLEAIASHMSGLPGRKNLVWLSGRFPFSFSPRSDFDAEETAGSMAQLERTARLLTDGNVAVYPISAVGLLAPVFNEPGASPYPSTINFGGRLAREPDSTNTMRQIARMTGGEAYYFTNGIAEAMSEAAEDSELIYTLGFYPDSNSMDTDFHELRVDVARDDVDVRHRRGYYGFGATDGDTSVLLVDLITSPVNATAIGLMAASETLDGDPGGSAMHLTVELNDLHLEFNDEVWAGQVEIATLVVSAQTDEPMVNLGTLDIVMTDDERREAIESGGYELFSMSSVQAEPAWLRVVVREPSSGASGSIWVALD